VGDTGGAPGQLAAWSSMRNLGKSLSQSGQGTIVLTPLYLVAEHDRSLLSGSFLDDGSLCLTWLLFRCLALGGEGFGWFVISFILFPCLAGLLFPAKDGLGSLLVCQEEFSQEGVLVLLGWCWWCL